MIYHAEVWILLSLAMHAPAATAASTNLIFHILQAILPYQPPVSTSIPPKDYCTTILFPPPSSHAGHKFLPCTCFWPGVSTPMIKTVQQKQWFLYLELLLSYSPHIPSLLSCPLQHNQHLTLILHTTPFYLPIRVHRSQ